MSKTQSTSHFNNDLQHPSSYQGVGLLLLVHTKGISLISLPHSLKNLAKPNLL